MDGVSKLGTLVLDYRIFYEQVLCYKTIPGEAFIVANNVVSLLHKVFKNGIMLSSITYVT